MNIHPAEIARAAQARLEKAQAEKPVQSRVKKDVMPFTEWCAKNLIIRGTPWSLSRHEYLAEIYDSLVSHPYVVAEKAAQVGMSTAELASAFYMCDSFEAKALYYLSTDDDADDFSQDRVNLMIDESEYLQHRVRTRKRGRDNVGLRHVGYGSFFVRGMYTRRKVKAVDADVLYLDELDEADQDNKALAYDRILHSDLQFIRELSQPSIPDYGIDETFARSDQRYWHLKCPACGQYTCLELHLEEQERRKIPLAIKPVPKNATWAKPDQKYYRACLHCDAPLEMSNGEWVAKHPSAKQIRGYHLSQLYTQIPAAGYADPADKLMDMLQNARKEKDRVRVTVSVLGYPYAGDRQPITDAVLDNAEGELAFKTSALQSYMGIDQGDLLYIVIGEPITSEKIRVIHLEIADDWSRVMELTEQFGVRVLVTDALPNKHDAKSVCRAISAQRGKRGYIQYFKDTPLKPETEGEGLRSVWKVTVDRTESLDETAKCLQEGDIVLPKMMRLDGDALHTYDIFRAQCKMLVKDLDEGASGVMRYVYKKNVPNHFGMALNSARIAAELSPMAAYHSLAESQVKSQKTAAIAGGIRGMTF